MVIQPVEPIGNGGGWLDWWTPSLCLSFSNLALCLAFPFLGLNKTGGLQGASDIAIFRLSFSDHAQCDTFIFLTSLVPNKVGGCKGCSKNHLLSSTITRRRLDAGCGTQEFELPNLAQS